MSDWEVWAAICLIAVTTAATRSCFWLIGHRVTIAPRIQEVLRYAPACALAAIVVPDLVLGLDGEPQVVLANPKLVAGAASLAFYLLRRNMLHTIGFGMLVFTLLRVFHIFGPMA